MSNNWQEIDNRLIKDFEFQDFNQAIIFINKIAEIANRLDHHPEIYNIYNKVKITLTTHDEGNKITEKDIEFRKEVDKLG